MNRQSTNKQQIKNAQNP